MITYDDDGTATDIKKGDLAGQGTGVRARYVFILFYLLNQLLHTDYITTAATNASKPNTMSTRQNASTTTTATHNRARDTARTPKAHFFLFLLLCRRLYFNSTYLQLL
jgi:hypothetical protein